MSAVRDLPIRSPFLPHAARRRLAETQGIVARKTTKMLKSALVRDNSNAACFADPSQPLTGLIEAHISQELHRTRASKALERVVKRPLPHARRPRDVLQRNRLTKILANVALCPANRGRRYAQRSPALRLFTKMAASKILDEMTFEARAGIGIAMSVARMIETPHEGLQLPDPALVALFREVDLFKTACTRANAVRETITVDTNNELLAIIRKPCAETTARMANETPATIDRNLRFSRFDNARPAQTKDKNVIVVESCDLDIHLIAVFQRSDADFRKLKKIHMRANRTDSFAGDEPMLLQHARDLLTRVVEIMRLKKPEVFQRLARIQERRAVHGHSVAENQALANAQISGLWPNKTTPRSRRERSIWTASPEASSERSGG